MIQRVQSIYLLLAALLAVAVPFAGGAVTPDSWIWYTPLKVALSILVAVGSLVAILLYGDRPKQKGLVVVLVLLAAGLTVLLMLGWWVSRRTDPAFWPLVFPLLAIAALFLARRAILKDIKLVRSMDRLR